MIQRRWYHCWSPWHLLTPVIISDLHGYTGVADPPIRIGTGVHICVNGTVTS